MDVKIQIEHQVAVGIGEIGLCHTFSGEKNMGKSMMKRWLVLGLSICGLVGVANAATIWNSANTPPDVSYWDDASNWSAGVPLSDTQTLIRDQSTVECVVRCEQDAGQIVMGANGAENYRAALRIVDGGVLNANALGSWIGIGYNKAESHCVVEAGGVFNSNTRVGVGMISPGIGFLDVYGDFTTAGALQIANTGEATVTVYQGGTIRAESLQMGNSGGSALLDTWGDGNLTLGGSYSNVVSTFIAQGKILGNRLTNNSVVATQIIVEGDNTFTHTLVCAKESIPNVAGLTLEEATSFLAGFDYVVGTITTGFVSGALSGNVLGQTPVAGSATLGAGAAIDLEIQATSVLSIVIDTDTQTGEFYNFWNVYPVTVQAPFLDEGQFDALRQTYRYAKYINCVRFLGGIDLEKDDYFRGVDEEGEAICDFTEGIAMLRGIHRCCFTPWIVLDNVPAAMSDPPTTNTYGNTEPPADFQVYSSYIRQLTETLIQEFGRDEVRRWRFRVGTEPDLNSGHWSGTMEQYFAHYDYTVAAVLSVLPDADIGPGNILDPVKPRNFESWGIAIIEHCANGTNYATGEIGTPLKFFASSYYTDVGTSDERFVDLVNLLRTELAKHPQFAEVPVEIHEFGILSENGAWIVGDGTELGGSWAAHFAEKISDLQVRRAFQWGWNTNIGGDLPTPITHVWDMLEEMVGGTRFSAVASRTSEEDHVGCLATKKDGHLDLLIFRHRSVRDNGQSELARLIIQGGATEDRTWTVTQAHIIDGQHPGFMGERTRDLQQAFAEAGEDYDFYAVAYAVLMENRDKYEQMSPLATLDPVPELWCDASGQIQLDLTLDGHSVVHLRLENLRDPASDPVVEMALNQGSSGTALSFDSVTGKYYSINFSTNLVVGPWGQLGTNLPGTGAEISVDDTNEWTQIYYRVEAQWP